MFSHKFFIALQTIMLIVWGLLVYNANNPIVITIGVLTATPQFYYLYKYIDSMNKS